MIFIETEVFTQQITQLIPDSSYKKLQEQLISNPYSGKVIRHSGGLRKIRWRLPDRGKRGGIRIIYYWYVEDDEIFMLLAYKKGKQTDLQPEQVKILRQLVKEEMK